MNKISVARIHGPNQVKLDPIDKPSPGSDDVLIEVASCGICGSDLSYAKLGGLPGAQTPMPIGHEFSGTVVKIGKNVSGLREGDRVVVNPEAAGNGIGSTGNNGAFSPFVCFRNFSKSPTGILQLPQKLDFEMGALVEPLSVAMHALKRGNCVKKDKVAIFGGGPVGLSAALVAKYHGVKDIVVVELSEKRIEVSQELGFTACNAQKVDVKEFLMAAHGNIKNNYVGAQPATDLFIEATGSANAFDKIIQLGCEHSRVSVVGVHFEPVKLNLLKVLMTEMTITASLAYTDEFPKVIEMLNSEKVNVAPLITHKFPLSEFEEAFQIAADKEQAVKVMIDCQG